MKGTPRHFKSNKGIERFNHAEKRVFQLLNYKFLSKTKLLFYSTIYLEDMNKKERIRLV